MTSLKSISILSVFVIAVLIAPACKSKKPLVQKPATVEEPAKPVAPPVEEKKPEPVKEQPAPAPTPPPAPDYNFSNIQFEFNSAVLKTGAYTILDKASRELKKDPSVKFTLNGYASAEGTDEHNMALSQERANAVKTYLINSGVSSDMLNAKGYGEANPVSKNTDEAGRALNRRVEIRKL
ncbi:MAG: OmpA family protein [Bacteroidota bacterium]